jgi:hypothetical protein
MTSPTSQPESKSTSRRALLAGALGGIGALAAGAIGRTQPVAAADGSFDTVWAHQVFADDSSGTGAITATTTSDSSAAVSAYNDGSGWGLFASNGGTGPAIQGDAQGSGGTGIRGDGRYGVWGETPQAGFYGVVGRNASTTFGGAGVRGINVAGDGVVGIGNAGGTGVKGQGRVGILGISSEDGWFGVWGQHTGNSPGINGDSNTGPGVHGTSTNGPGGFFEASGTTNPPGVRATATTGDGIYAISVSGSGIHAQSASGFAGYFAGKVYVSKFQEMPEISTPSAPAANRARLFVRDDGSGHTQLCVRFNTGTVKILATEG